MLWAAGGLRWAWYQITWCCQRRGGDGPGAHLPPPPPAPLLVRWRGPGLGGVVEAEFYTKGVRGRGTNRACNHVLLRKHGQVARVSCNFAD
eukprot:9485079-Pyramimonas_sp.AAC.1